MTSDNPAPEIAKTSIGRRLRGYLLAGILVTAPITLTVYLTYLFLTFIDAKVASILPLEMYETYYARTTIPGVGLLVAIVFFMTVGWFATNFLGRTVIRVSEYIVDKMPIIRTIYGAIKQIMETIMASQGNAFREAVMLEYPRKGIWSIGFVTGKAEGEVQRLTENEVVNVFLPTTPNPTSGFLLFVPKKDLVFLEMSVEDAVKLVVSAGIINPAEKKKKTAKAKK
ncbi:MAG: DUF502 domain-containing protein [Alphaproteobacteria bacterium]|nr:DUF502 domain-containing protein [Alphaproteobacteria bacterium]MCD8526239.1 DUF502 domain-containing protein [Alphaproteobacteria bacterium]